VNNPVIELTNVPVPVPFVVQLSAVAGLGDVLQHTPFAETVEPPPSVALPPLMADVVAIPLTGAVVTDGGFAGDVVKFWSRP
jgi:hypothetical protein